MRHNTFWQTLFTLCYLFLGLQFPIHSALATPSPDNNRTYSKALALAHSKHPVRALSILQQLTQQFPDVLRYRYDYIQVAVWAGKPQQALAQGRFIYLDNAPDYVVDALASAAQKLHHFSQAEKAWKQLEQRHPNTWQYAFKRAQMLLRQKKTVAAHALLKKLKAKHPNNQTILTLIRSVKQVKQDQQHQYAVNLARQGQLKKALKILEQEIRQYPQQKRYFYDYLQVLFWDNQYDKVLQQSQNLKLETLPNFVLQAIALSARHNKQFDKAKMCYQILTQRSPQNDNYQIGLAAVLIDQKNLKTARKIIDSILNRFPYHLEALKVQAYLYEQEDELLKAADTYLKILGFAKDNKEAIRGRVFALAKMSFFTQAWQSALLHRQYFSDSEWVKLHWDLAANMIRWGEIPAKRSDYRYAETHQAITRIKQNLSMLESMEIQDKAIWRQRALFDLLVALRDAKRMRQAVDLYRSLQQSGVNVPAYAKIAAADAFLYQEQPEQARNLYLEVLKDIPSSYNARQSLIYAYLEAEQPNLARALALQMAKQQPNKLRFKKPGSQNKFYTRGNPRKTETELAVAVIEAFTDRLKQAQKKIDFLYKNAPHNTDIRNARANIYYYRGWPRQAYEQLVSALNIDPKHLSNRLSLSPVLHDLRLYAAEQQNTEALYQEYYENKGVQRQMRLWNIHNQRELRISTQGELSKTQSNAPSPVNGSESVGIDTLLFSHPLAYHYRLFAHQNWQTSVFNDGTGRPVRGYFRRYGLGLEYSIPNLVATGEVHYDNFKQHTVGFAGTLNYQFDDYWSANIRFDSRSQEIGLRALTSGRVAGNRSSAVTAWSVAAGFDYRAHESQSITFNQNFFIYNDGNFRYAANGQYYQRWYSGPQYKFSTRLNFGTSLNTRQSGNYYHPENDASLGLTLDHDFLTYRHYDLSFYQRIALTSAFYFQKEITTNPSKPVQYHFDPVGSIQYEHRWKTLNRYELTYGAIRRYTIYDGDRTEDWAFYLNLSMRF
jgi:biofilm PGA synthesis protein PgaA